MTSKIPTAAVPFVDKPMPRILCGTDFLLQQPPRDSFAAFDAYWEAGGRAFDTAHIYGMNTNLFGTWVKARGVAKETIFFDKGCHHYGDRKRVTREDMRQDVFDNHERLGVDYTDLFVLHRDDENVPVGEIIDWLNELKDEGYIGAFGGSNWHHLRLQAANEYAEKAGKQPMSLGNPNLSLGHANEPMWGGCISLDEEARRWYAETGFPLFSWSSTARGYFAGVIDSDVQRVFVNEINAGRLARTKELGEKYGMSSVQIALAWVLNQPGNVFALCGLRSKDNVAENVAAATLKLSTEELRYLEFGE
ncbi:aldo/keto reductase [bacterium]|nr:MAG: aldo/keto reductase [bacterium]